MITMIDPMLVCVISNGQMLYVDQCSRLQRAGFLRLLRKRGFRMRKTVKHWALREVVYEGANDRHTATITFQ